MTSTTYDVTYFSHRGARSKTEATISLSDLAEQIRSAQAEAKDLLPWIKLAKFGAVKTNKGSLRHDANVISVTGVEGDYDGEQISFDDALDTLGKAGVEALLYTSPSHEPDKPRWRVLCPLSAPHAPTEREHFMRRLNGLFGGAISDESFTLSQSYYFGHLIKCLEYRVEVIDGQCIDLCDELDKIARGKSGTKTGDGGNGQDGSSRERVDVDELIRRIVSGESLHPSVLRIAGSYAARNFPKTACVDIIGIAFTKAGIPRYDGRWGECLDIINYTYNKEEKKRTPPPPPPADAVGDPTTGDKTYSHLWRSKDYDFPCTPTGAESRDADGRIYAEVSTQDGTSTVPKDELVPAQRGNGAAEGEDDTPPDVGEIHDDTPPPPANVTDIGVKLKRKPAKSSAQPAPEPDEEPEEDVGSPPPQPASQQPYHRPVIPLRPGHLPETLDAAEAALKAAGFAVLALDTILVCPRRVRRPASDGREIETTRFIPISTGQMRRWLGEAAAFTRFDKRSQRYVPCDPPTAFAKALLETPASWGFPSVAGLSSCPVMRADGSICAISGYDPATQLYIALATDLVMPDVPENPSREQAKAAFDRLLGLLDEFQFETDTDRAVALAWLMVPALRPAMEVCPLILFRANVSGSGKSYLVDLGAAISSGQKFAAVIGAGPNHEETEKRLGALLLEGVTHVAVDNMDTDIEGKSIWCFVSERPRLKLRILGLSRTPEIENVAYCTCTGNNIQAKDDLVRRVLTCSMNVPVERPEKRRFAKNPVRMVLENRGAYLAAIFTIAKHYMAAGSPDLGDDMWESYSDFVRLVRNPLRHLDPKLDPVRSVDTAREEDPTVVAISELFGHWEQLLKADEPAGAYQVYEKATERDVQLEKLQHPEFQDLLQRVCAGKYGKISSKSVGSWLKRIAGRVIKNRRLVQVTDPNKYHGPRYRLEAAPGG